MKKFLIRFLRSLFNHPVFAVQFSDAILSHPEQHLFRSRTYIKQNKLHLHSDTIVDVGCADGSTCTWFARSFPGHRIIGFEPFKESFEKALQNTSRFKNVEIHNVAMDETEGESTLHITADPLATSLLVSANPQGETGRKIMEIKHETLKTSTLDKIISGDTQILLLKLDTQGTELRILRGGVNTLSRTSLVLVELNNHELYTGGAQYYEVDEFLRKNNFRLIDIYVTYRPGGQVSEYDALYRNCSL